MCTAKQSWSRVVPAMLTHYCLCSSLPCKWSGRGQNCMTLLPREQALPLPGTRALIFSFPSIRFFGKFQVLWVCCLNIRYYKKPETQVSLAYLHSCQHSYRGNACSQEIIDYRSLKRGPGWKRRDEGRRGASYIPPLLLAGSFLSYTFSLELALHLAK